MLLLQFFHEEEILFIDNREYKATCRVRNELNGWRRKDEIVRTYGIDGKRSPYYPRKFPTGVWTVKEPIWTRDPIYSPVKIPTNAIRTVLTRENESGNYGTFDGETIEDSFYHLHYSEGSTSTLGCIRLDSSSDAADIANLVSFYLGKKQKVFLEVNIKRG